MKVARRATGFRRSYLRVCEFNEAKASREIRGTISNQANVSDSFKLSEYDLKLHVHRSNVIIRARRYPTRTRSNVYLSFLNVQRQHAHHEHMRRRLALIVRS